jgi:hypothetical protein
MAALRFLKNRVSYNAVVYGFTSSSIKHEEDLVYYHTLDRNPRLGFQYTAGAYFVVGMNNPLIMDGWEPLTEWHNLKEISLKFLKDVENEV